MRKLRKYCHLKSVDIIKKKTLLSSTLFNLTLLLLLSLKNLQ